MTLEEQLKIQRGELKPSSVNDLLIELTHASGINFARDFATSYKVFDTVQDIDPVPAEPPYTESINTLASGYLNKMLSATNRMITADSSAIQSLNNVMASLIADINGISEATIIGAPSSIWEGFINAEIDRAFELFAQVRQEEKEEYDNLP